jgi:CubicO group peptidase (beta-lactamase class C family)
MNYQKHAMRISVIVLRTIAIIFFIILVATNSAQAIFPGTSWDVATPESQNVNSFLLEDAVDYLESLPAADKSTELVIVRNGYVIWRGTNVDNVHGVWSVTKSFLSILFGLLVEDQKVTLETLAKSVDANLSSQYSNVKMKHFLTMTSGYRAIGDENGSYCHGSSGTPFNPGSPLFAPPGSHFAYWDSAANELGFLITKIAKVSMESLFQERIATKIGLSANAWDWGDFGRIDGLTINGGAGNGGNHVFISAIELARVGHLLLNKGNWNGEQLIDANWIDQATQVQVPVTMPLGSDCDGRLDARGTYGYLWWVNGIRADGNQKWFGATSRTFAASGANNNKLFVIPELEMVIVRLGLDSGQNNSTVITDNQWGQFLSLVEQSVTDTPPACILASHFAVTSIYDGMEYYTDRDYIINSVPEKYIGLDAILLPNDHRNRTDDSDYLTFKMPEDGPVYVAYDSRAISEPNWMNGFTDTGDIIKTSLASQPSLKIYSRNYNAGDCVNFGANKASGFAGNIVSNYLVYYGAGGQTPVCVLDSRFEKTTLAVGMEYYTDRDYVLTTVPAAYRGMDTIRTPNDERNFTTASNYMTFKMPDDDTVYVAYDSRAISEPDWMNGFIDTGDIILTSLSTQLSLRIYSKYYEEGYCINFGANKASGFAGNIVSNFIVFYGNGGPVDCNLDTKFKETMIDVGEYYYTDRTYTITGGIPDWMIGRTLIRTVNDERKDTSSSGYVRFKNSVDWWVYVLFDSRSSSIPDWLNGWELRGEKITTSLSSQPYLKVYRKQYPSGHCVDLGGNYGPGSSTETRSNYAVVYGK